MPKHKFKDIQVQREYSDVVSKLSKNSNKMVNHIDKGTKIAEFDSYPQISIKDNRTEFKANLKNLSSDVILLRRQIKESSLQLHSKNGSDLAKDNMIEQAPHSSNLDQHPRLISESDQFKELANADAEESRYTSIIREKINKLNVKLGEDFLKDKKALKEEKLLVFPFNPDKFAKRDAQHETYKNYQEQCIAYLTLRANEVCDKISEIEHCKQEKDKIKLPCSPTTAMTSLLQRGRKEELLQNNLAKAIDDFKQACEDIKKSDKRISEATAQLKKVSPPTNEVELIRLQLALNPEKYSHVDKPSLEGISAEQTASILIEYTKNLAEICFYRIFKEADEAKQENLCKNKEAIIKDLSDRIWNWVVDRQKHADAINKLDKGIEAAKAEMTHHRKFSRQTMFFLLGSNLMQYAVDNTKESENIFGRLINQLIGATLR